jgi:hypothetical protein
LVPLLLRVGTGRQLSIMDEACAQNMGELLIDKQTNFHHYEMLGLIYNVNTWSFRTDRKPSSCSKDALIF